MLPLTQMRFDVLYQNERYLIQRSSPPPSREGEDMRKRAVHHGVDPRAYMGVDPMLRSALKNFVGARKERLELQPVVDAPSEPAGRDAPARFEFARASPSRRCRRSAD